MKKTTYPIGSVSCATMREEDLIPEFTFTLKQCARNRSIGDVSAKDRKEHIRAAEDIECRMESDGYYESEEAGWDLNEFLFDALNEYAGPYFYFGSHPGDGADYGFWLSESFDEEFDGLKVADTSEVPRGYRGEVLHVNDHGNMTLYVTRAAGGLREVWAVV